MDDAGLPLNRFLVRINVPEAVWKLREEVLASKLPVTWSAIPAGRASMRFGSEWLASLRSPILLVLSVIVPEEWISLINPLHPSARKITASVVRPLTYSSLFRR